MLILSMEAYQYNELNVFVGVVECQRNPLRREEFLLPRNCTFVKPPELEENEKAIFKDGNWEIEKIKEDDFVSFCKILLENPTKDNLKIIIKVLVEKI